MNTYTIQRGDTLWGISQKLKQQGYNISPDELARMNGISDPNKIFAGADLKLPERAAQARPADPSFTAGPTGGTPPALAPQNVRAEARAPAPWSISPPGMMMGKMADMLGLPNTPAPLPSMPAPMRAAAGVGRAVVDGMAGAVPPRDPRQDAIQPVNWEEALAGGVGVLALPAMIMKMARMAPRAAGPTAFGNLRGAGQVAEPMARGAVPHAAAKPTFSNVRPVGNNPEAVARTIQSASPEALTSQALQRAPTMPNRPGIVDPQLPPVNPYNPQAPYVQQPVPMLPILEILRRMGQ